MTTDRTAADRQRRRRAKLRNDAELSLVRHDWALFLQPDRLAQKAGCAMRHLRRMTIKELVDNAADTSTEVKLEQLDNGDIRVADLGPGLDRARVLELFAINRPMTSSKLWRKPTRGAVGNGLRVVTGAVLGTEGTLIVESLGRCYRLEVDRGTGETRIAAESESDVTQGTAITVHFGPGLPVDTDLLAWARIGAALAGPAARPMRSHPSWYTECAWRELNEAAVGYTAAELLASGFGIEVDDDLRPAGALTLPEAQQLGESVPEPKLLPIPIAAFPGAHAQVQDRRLGVPVLVQAWAIASRVAPRAHGSLEIELILNRTIGPAKLVGYFADRKPVIKGCQLHYGFEGKPAAYWLTIAVTSPYLPMVTDGKEPDLDQFADPICDAAMAAMRKAYAKVRPPTAARTTIVEAAFACMADAYLKASAQGTLPANARQVYYAARPDILAMTGEDKLASNYFTQTVLPRYLEEHPEETAAWDIVYDARGHLTEPHTGHIVALGTLEVRGYLAPRSTGQGPLVQVLGNGSAGATTDRYRTALFIEKEGFEPLIAAAGIRERFDVAVLSTKGMSTTAARTLVERLSCDGVRILVAHDLDRAGKSILGTLAGDTRRYRYEVIPNVTDIGLTLAHCRAFGLQDEENPIAKDTDRDRVRKTLAAHGAKAAEIRFLVDEERRIELNAMTSDVFVTWLETRLMEHGAGKVVPDNAVLEEVWQRAMARQHIAKDLRRAETKAMAAAIKTKVPADLAGQVRAMIEGTARSWDHAIDTLASRSWSDG